MPRVSVVMAVRDGSSYLGEAINSILGQTLSDFEFIIVNDGSRDGTPEVIAGYEDPRIVVFVNDRPLGLSASLNIGISKASGGYIARMDHDDISLPSRLAAQVEFLERNSNVDVVGTWAKTYGLEREQTWKYPEAHDDICSEMLFSSVLVHSSVIWRATTFKQKGITYREDVERAQDYELWTRAIDKGVRLANLPRVLLKYRIHEDQVGKRFGSQQSTVADSVRVRALDKLELQPSKDELDLHHNAARWVFPSDLDGLKRLENWFARIVDANRRTSVYKPDSLAKTLERRWWAACRGNLGLGTRSWTLYADSTLAAKRSRSVSERFSFWAKAILRSAAANAGDTK
jgi:glycosyltransferase involved in cell wall biosynthesis